jgi:uncharacterized membrane protein YvbJ
VKFCPNCGAGVEPGAASCESCGAELGPVQSALARSAPAAPAPAIGPAVADLTPRRLRKEIRWGVFQGILLAGAIVLVVYLVVILLVAGVINTVVSGG